MDEMLKVNNLSVEYKEFTLHPISFTMKKGEILSIIGDVFSFAVVWMISKVREMSMGGKKNS